MQVNTHNTTDAVLQISTAKQGAAPTPSEGGAGFAAPMSEAIATAKIEAEERAKEIRTAAEQLVASTFVMPLFSQLRSDPMASEMFHGGRGEKIFQQQLDQILSDRISTGAGFDLVDTVAAYFNGRPTGASSYGELMDAARTRVQHSPTNSEGVDVHG